MITIRVHTEIKEDGYDEARRRGQEKLLDLILENSASEWIVRNLMANTKKVQITVDTINLSELCELREIADLLKTRKGNEDLAERMEKVLERELISFRE